MMETGNIHTAGGIGRGTATDSLCQLVEEQRCHGGCRLHAGRSLAGFVPFQLAASTMPHVCAH